MFILQSSYIVIAMTRLSDTFRRLSRGLYQARSMYTSTLHRQSFSTRDVILFLAVATPLISGALTLRISRTESESELKHDANVQALLNDLAHMLESDQIDISSEECSLRGKPWNSYHKSPRDPQAVIFPSSTEQVSAILRLCNQHRVPVVAFGGGTSIEGHTLALRGGVSLDMSRMRRVLALREGDLDCEVQAGLGYVELNELLRTKGLWFPLDPGPGASVGGMCACRCSGSTALKYGSMRENVLNVTAVLADGTILKTGTRARKSSAGYDLTRLLIGSEGTLAIITEACLKVHPIPKHALALRVSFPSAREAALAATGALKEGISLCRAEMMDEQMVAVINRTNPSLTPWPERVTLLFEVLGASSAGAEEQLTLLQTIVERVGGRTEEVLSDPVASKALWLLRKQALWSAMSAYPDREAMITDVCVPLSALPAMVEATRDVTQHSSLPCPTLAHAGDGNLHVLIMLRPGSAEDRDEAKRIAAAMIAAAQSLGGTCTGEHGVGCGKKAALRVEAGEGGMRLMETIKRAMDPHNTLNPDKVIDANRICS